MSVLTAIERIVWKRRLEAAHWVIRTSFEPQSVSKQFPVSQIFDPQLYTRFPCCTHSDHDAPFQRDSCDRSMCKGSDGHQRLFSYLVVLVSVTRQCGIVLEPCLQRVILTDIRIPHVVSSCTTHLIAYICSRRLRRYFWWWDLQTLVDSGGTRALWSGRAVGIQGYETKEEHPQTQTKNPLTRGGASFIGQARWGPKYGPEGDPSETGRKIEL